MISSILLLIFSSFREISTTLHPFSTRASTNPRPTPSVAPVTTAHLPLSSPQRDTQLFGMSYFRICHRMSKNGLARKTNASESDRVPQSIQSTEMNIIIIDMNRVREQKKDVTRALKVMRSEALGDGRNQNSLSQSKDFKKADNLALLYASSNTKKGQQSQQPRRNLRYEKTHTEHENSYHHLITKKQGSLDLRRTKLRPNSQEKQSLSFKKNPYLSRYSRNSFIARPTTISQKGRRLLTHEAKHYPNQQVVLKKSEEARDDKAPSLEEARSEFSRGNFISSQKLVNKILLSHPNNHQALYLSGVNNLSQHYYVKSLAAFNRLIDLDPAYKDTVYIMSSLCYLRLGKANQGLKRINSGIEYFPESAECNLHKGSILMKLGSFEEALPILKYALKLSKEIVQPLTKLAHCYQNLKQYDSALSIYDQLTLGGDQTTKSQKLYLKKAKCLKKLNKYHKLIEALQKYLQLSSPETQGRAEVYYELGYGHYKLKDYPSVIMCMEEVFKEKDPQFALKALKLLVTVHILERDFYEAWHCLSRKEHLDIGQQQLQFYELLCEGVVSLMKRKFDIGLEKLEQVTFSTENNEEGELQRDAAVMYPMYLSYAYFCEGDMVRCLEQINQILSSSDPTLLKFHAGVRFNKLLCEGLESVRKSNYQKGAEQFEESTRIYPEKPEGFFYLGLCKAQMYLKDHKISHLEECNKILAQCISNLKELNNNYASSAFYCKALVSCQLEQWEDAMCEIDEAVERSEENEAKMFYLRGTILGCCQSYKQAIHEVSVAISVDANQPSYYLLRSKCYQIEGDGNMAFADLQSYITLNPDDTEIHKFAGHLLFQNGAFEDALQAYDNGQVIQTEQNVDVFLTRSKTHFLLGNFDSCITDMKTALKFRDDDLGMEFDIQVMELLRDFFQNYNKNQASLSRLKEILSTLARQKKGGRIFRKIELKMLEALFTFYLADYVRAVKLFQQTIKLKEDSFMESSMEEFEQEEKEKYFFITQMHHNIGISLLLAHKTEEALKQLEECHFKTDSKIKGKFEELMAFIRGQKVKDGASLNCELISQKNKMSRLLDELTIKIEDKRTLFMKLCVPFPKVEPPEINPKFDPVLLQELHPRHIERKPEAPWILRENNSIKFTDKIERFSRLDINASEMSKGEQKKPLGLSQNESSLDYQESIESINEVREKLKLDGELESRLNRLINRGR